MIFVKNAKENQENPALEKIQLKHLIIAFTIIGSGCLVALVVLLLEICWGRKVLAKQEAMEQSDQSPQCIKEREDDLNDDKSV